MYIEYAWTNFNKKERNNNKKQNKKTKKPPKYHIYILHFSELQLRVAPFHVIQAESLNDAINMIKLT